MILSLVFLVLAAFVAVALLPVIFMYVEWPLFVLIAGFLIIAWLLLCYVTHVQALLIDHVRKRRGR